MRRRVHIHRCHLGGDILAVWLMSAYSACWEEAAGSVIDVLIHNNLGDQWLALTRTRHPH
jgi:hypothetical protein